MPPVDLPAIEITDTGWEISIPRTALPPALAMVSLWPEGIYIETADGAWDILSLEDLAALVEDAPTRVVERPSIYQDLTQRAAILARLLQHPGVIAG